MKIPLVPNAITMPGPQMYAYTSIRYITYQQGEHAKRSRKEGVVYPLTQVDG